MSVITCFSSLATFFHMPVYHEWLDFTLVAQEADEWIT